MPEFYFDEAEAKRATEFYPKFLRHVKGEWAGQPIELMPWMRDEIIRPLFGWKRSDGTRRYRQAYIEVPRKNAKSTLCAGIGGYLLFCDHEPGAEIYSAAADRDQARIVFGDAKSMIKGSPELDTRCEVWKNSIVVPRTNSSWKVLSADVATKHGLNAHGIIFDELHTQPNRDLYDVLHTSTGARRQPLEVYITTAGFDRHSICWELHDYADKVIHGIIEDTAFLPVIHAADEADDWRLESTWRKANPSYGISIKEEYLAKECKRAQESPAYENTFRRLHLNQWTEQDVRWMQMEKWDACNFPVTQELLRGRRCYGGLDLATVNDLASFVLIFPDDDNAVVAYNWVPADNILKRSRRDRVSYDVWVKKEFIKATPGNVIDYDCIRKDINDIASLFQIEEIGFDPYNATQLSTQLQDDGITMVPLRQGAQTMSEPTKEVMKLVLGKQLKHGGNPVLRWAASNVTIRQDSNGNIKMDKERSSEKIDPMVALAMAVRGIIVHSDPVSIYEQRGVISV